MSTALGFTVGYAWFEDVGQPAIVDGLLGAMAGLFFSVGISVGIVAALAQRAARARADATR